MNEHVFLLEKQNNEIINNMEAPGNLSNLEMPLGSTAEFRNPSIMSKRDTIGSWKRNTVSSVRYRKEMLTFSLNQTTSKN